MKIDIIDIKENNNGTCEIIFDYDEEFVELVKESLGKNIVSEEDISNYVVAAVDRGIATLSKKRSTKKRSTKKRSTKKRSTKKKVTK